MSERDEPRQNTTGQCGGNVGEGAAAMREALGKTADQIEKIAFSIRPPNVYTPQLAMLADALRAYSRRWG